MAAAGVASRRAAEELIVAGRVLVNDKTEVLPQTKVVLGKDKVGARVCYRLLPLGCFCKRAALFLVVT